MNASGPEVEMQESAAPDSIPGPVGDRFANRVAIVAGGGSGSNLGVSPVGAAICRLLASERCRVAVLDCDAAAAERTVVAIKREGGDAFAIRGDVSVNDDCRHAVQSVISTYGQLDVLVNNLGLLPTLGRRAAVADISEDEWDQVMDVNAKGPMLMIKHAVQHMASGGAIVNISSIGAIRPAFGGSIPYAASKGALQSLTVVLAVQEAYRQIRVNCVCVGNVWTPRVIQRLRDAHDDVDSVRDRRRLLNPLEIEGTAWDVAHATAFLASDQARWITGQILVVDGGATVAASGEARPKR